MFSGVLVLILSYVLSSITLVSGLGSTCSTPLGAGTAGANDPFWMQNIKHQGISAFNSAPGSYQVFRNVMDFGAKGDGVTDDTAAINSAMSSGGRCGGGTCPSSTLSPAIIYFPPGTYIVSSPITTYYFTEMVGDARNPPTIKATAGFSGIAVIDADPYGSNGNWFTAQDNFYRSVRNFVIDLRQMPATTTATGFHWQVAQATSLYNIVVEMSTASGNAHRGMYMENGSGGFMGDLVFNGGNNGIWVGNQQFTVRNITFNNAATAIFGLWNWGWTFQGVTINNCQIGFDITTGANSTKQQTVGAEAIIDAVVTNTPIFIRSSTASAGSLKGSLVLNNIKLNNVPTAVGLVGGATVLAGGTTTIASWGQGDVYTGTSGTKSFIQGNIPAPHKSRTLLDSAGRIFGKTRPQYAAYSVSQFVSARDQGAKGDGNTDDTQAINSLLSKYAGCKIIYFDAGTYIVSSTITIPAGTQIVGEAWPTIMGTGSAFSNQNNPAVVVQVGTPGSTGLAEISGILFKTRGPAPGAIVVEWNVHDPSGSKGAAGMWDSHIIIGGAAGTNLEKAQCPSGSDNTACTGAFLGLHLTRSSSAYLESTWVWTADHDIDGDGSSQLTIFTGRGILSQSAGPVWLIGTASEHSTIYQYNLVGAQNHYIGTAQTETPYYQPSPSPPTPFSINSAYSDPSLPSGNNAAWAVNIQSSSNIILFGGGFYNFFQNYGQTCLSSSNCQSQILNVDTASTGVNIYSISTIGTTYQLSVGSTGIIQSSDNPNGFAQTFTSWSR